MLDGILIVNKPQGITSHDVVDYARKKLGMKRIGHAGTLDPLATGVLIILVGRTTKFFNAFSGLDKEYLATVTLGKTTTSGDSQGEIIESFDFSHVSEEKAQATLRSFIGESEQVPPMVSAIKYKGRKLYQLARAGIEVPRQPRKVNIKELRLLKFNLPDIELYLRCSKGTYVRKLAEDIGERLECGGYISKIQRISVGEFNIKEAVDIEEINAHNLKSWKVQA